MTKYKVLSEWDTLKSCRHSSIARFGDGELRLAVGGGCSSQEADPKLAQELRDVLAFDTGTLLACVPNFDATPNSHVWDKYREPKFAKLLKCRTYGSAFITRPDNAPWIDTPEYWDAVRDLWRGRNVVLVTGDHKSLTADVISEAKSVVQITGPNKNAYSVVQDLEEQVLAVAKSSAGETYDRIVLLCLGACATVLAARLDRHHVHALDLGHIGMFMRHAGAYATSPDALASKDYRKQLMKKHAAGRWGTDGHRWAHAVTALAERLDAKSVLDYGCGAGTLKEAMKSVRVFEYDPGIKGKDAAPKPSDVVVCTDVLEHVEPERVDAVLQHILLLTGRAAFLVVSLRPAREKLPDGRNAHLTVQSGEWWRAKLKAQAWGAIQAWNKSPDTLIAQCFKNAADSFPDPGEVS